MASSFDPVQQLSNTVKVCEMPRSTESTTPILCAVGVAVMMTHPLTHSHPLTHHSLTTSHSRRLTHPPHSSHHSPHSPHHSPTHHTPHYNHSLTTPHSTPHTLTHHTHFHQSLQNTIDKLNIVIVDVVVEVLEEEGHLSNQVNIANVIGLLTKVVLEWTISRES